MHTHRHTHQLLEKYLPSGVATMYVSECMCGKYIHTH